MRIRIVGLEEDSIGEINLIFIHCKLFLAYFFPLCFPIWAGEYVMKEENMIYCRCNLKQDAKWEERAPVLFQFRYSLWAPFWCCWPWMTGREAVGGILIQPECCEQKQKDDKTVYLRNVLLPHAANLCHITKSLVTTWQVLGWVCSWVQLLFRENSL